jgi:hypothetical protein
MVAHPPPNWQRCHFDTNAGFVDDFHKNANHQCCCVIGRHLIPVLAGIAPSAVIARIGAIRLTWGLLN